MIELRVVGGWLVDLQRNLRANLERMREPMKLPPIPDEDPE